jgi:DNA-binding transcriptional ArsR family regulator
VLPGGNYPVLAVLTRGLLVRKEPRYDQWLQILEQHLERYEHLSVWRALARWLPYVVRAERQRAEAFLSRLVDKYPALLRSDVGVGLIAQSMHWVADDKRHRWIDALADGTWERGAQARGELIGVLAMRRDPPPWVGETAEAILSSDNDGAALGLTYAATYLWSEPWSREVATEWLVRLIPSTRTPERAAAVMGVFDRSPRLLGDAATTRLLDALIANPGVLSSRTVRFAEQLEALCLFQPERVAKVAIAFIDSVTKNDDHGMGALYVAGPVLVDIAVTLQRLSRGAREHGLALFEKLLENECRGARELLRMIDQGTGAPQ